MELDIETKGRSLFFFLLQHGRISKASEDCPWRTRSLARGTAAAVVAHPGFMIGRASLTNQRPRGHHASYISRRCTEAAKFDATQAIRVVRGTKQKLGCIR